MVSNLPVPACDDTCLMVAREIVLWSNVQGGFLTSGPAVVERDGLTPAPPEGKKTVWSAEWSPESGSAPSPVGRVSVYPWWATLQWSSAMGVPGRMAERTGRSTMRGRRLSWLTMSCQAPEPPQRLHPAWSGEEARATRLGAPNLLLEPLPHSKACNHYFGESRRFVGVHLGTCLMCRCYYRENHWDIEHMNSRNTVL